MVIFFDASILCLSFPFLTSLINQIFFVLNFNFPNEFLGISLLTTFKSCCRDYNIYTLLTYHSLHGVYILPYQYKIKNFESIAPLPFLIVSHKNVTKFSTFL